MYNEDIAMKKHIHIKDFIIKQKLSNHSFETI